MLAIPVLKRALSTAPTSSQQPTIFFFFSFWVATGSMWDFSSLTRDQIQAPLPWKHSLSYWLPGTSFHQPMFMSEPLPCHVAYPITHCLPYPVLWTLPIDFCSFVQNGLALSLFSPRNFRLFNQACLCNKTFPSGSLIEQSLEFQKCDVNEKKKEKKERKTNKETQTRS